MTPFQLTRTGFVLLGTYFVLTGLVSPLVSAVGYASASRDSEYGGELGWGLLSYALPTLLLMALPGAILIGKSRQLAERLWPIDDAEPTVSVAAEDAARIAVSLLGLYFAIGGLGNAIAGLALFFGTTPDTLMSATYVNLGHGTARILFGVLLFFQAPSLARFLTHRE